MDMTDTILHYLSYVSIFYVLIGWYPSWKAGQARVKAAGLLPPIPVDYTQIPIYEIAYLRNRFFGIIDTVLFALVYEGKMEFSFNPSNNRLHVDAKPGAVYSLEGVEMWVCELVGRSGAECEKLYRLEVGRAEMKSSICSGIMHKTLKAKGFLGNLRNRRIRTLWAIPWVMAFVWLVPDWAFVGAISVTLFVLILLILLVLKYRFGIDLVYLAFGKPSTLLSVEEQEWLREVQVRFSHLKNVECTSVELVEGGITYEHVVGVALFGWEIFRDSPAEKVFDLYIPRFEESYDHMSINKRFD